MLNRFFALSFVVSPAFMASVASAGPGLGGWTPGGGQIDDDYSLAQFDGVELNESVVEDIVDSEGDSLLGWGACAGDTDTDNEDDCVLLVVGAENSYSDIRLSADSCSSGTACYGGYTIDHKAHTDLYYSSSGLDLESSRWTRNDTQMMGGSTRSSLALYGTADGYSNSSSYWITWYDAEGSVVTGAGANIEGSGASCEMKAQLASEMAALDITADSDMSAGIAGQAIACMLVSTLDSITGAFGNDSGSVGGSVDASSWAKEECDRLEQLLDVRHTAEITAAADAYAQFLAECEGVCPDSVSYYKDYSTSDGDQCYHVEAECDEMGDVCTCSGTATPTDDSNCD